MVAIRKFKTIIAVKFFLKMNKIKIEKIISKNIGSANKLTIINVEKNKNIYRSNFFTFY